MPYFYKKTDMNTKTDVNTKTEKWYKALSYDEKFIIQVACFGYVNLTQTNIISWIKRAAIKTTSGNDFDDKIVAPVLMHAAKNNMLEIQSKSYYYFEPEFTDMVAEDIRNDRKTFEKMSEIFTTFFKPLSSESYWYSENELNNSYAALFQALMIDDSKRINFYSSTLKLSQRGKHFTDVYPSLIFRSQDMLSMALYSNNFKHIDSEWLALTVSLASREYFVSLALSCLLKQKLNAGMVLPGNLDEIAAVHYFMTAQFRKLDALIVNSSVPNVASIHAISLIVRGMDDEAIRKLDIQLSNQAKACGTKVEYVLDNYTAIFQVPFLLNIDKSKISKVTKAAKEHDKKWNSVLKLFVSCFKNIGLHNADTNFKMDLYKLPTLCTWDYLVKVMCLYWLNGKITDQMKEDVARVREHAALLGSYMLELETTCLLNFFDANHTYEEQINKLKKDFGVTKCLSEFFTPGSEWELRLALLAGLNLGNKEAGDNKEERLIWLVSPKSGSVQPVIQKSQKNGGWSSGRNVSLAKLKGKEVDCTTEHDVAVIKRIKQNHDYYDNSYYFEDDAVVELAGHPLLFHADSPTIPMEIAREDIQLVVDEKAGKCTFSFSHSLTKDVGKLVKETTNMYKVIVASDAIKNISAIIGESMTVPSAAKSKVIDVIKHLSGSVKIQSPLVGEQTGAQRVKPFPGLFVHLMPSGNGIKADIFVKPLNPLPPYLRPGDGLAKVVGHDKDRNLWTERELKQELKSVNELMDRCPVLATQAADELSAYFNDPSECLQVLSELRDAVDKVTVEWPRGQKFSIRAKLSFANFNASVKKQNNWFDLQGELRIDENTVLDLRKMLDLIETSSKGRFVEIEDGVFVELEKHFVKQLEYLNAVSDKTAKQIKLHPLAAISSAGLFESASDFKGDKQWNSFIDNIRKTEKNKYQLPRGLDAELRPYQEEGYRWLRKMADWQTGACLADDMGLGKTLQCIALLLSRVKEGPSLVIAPASVCRNWMSEVEKFTTGIQPVLFGAGDRKQVVEQLEAGALLVVSYGLLNTEGELLASRKWNVMILDEAHAIKNIGTKRAQSAMSVDAAVKIAATGTPLQNHMGELWNLFQFLNPGLLGSQQAFNERFVIPIEKSNNELARRSLKDLIKPFILRRTKNQVLDELPDKTEITLQVEMSDAERTFYEALRLKALTDIQTINNTANSGEKQLRVLAEIMKLRRACCHSSLANKDINLDSAKLQRFEELVDDLIENGHKALVFSQFVDHLALISKLLDSKGIPFEYLDGSSPMKEREESIRRFQAGSTDLFLISLKAGGVGLNLTAADYVIHMDPWWNPAVEDQASDRAHRIGQTKPVTIYRLVTKDTIEDKIVELHKNKRDLADSLLEGTESAARVTADDLVSLLKL